MKINQNSRTEGFFSNGMTAVEIPFNQFHLLSSLLDDSLLGTIQFIIYWAWSKWLPHLLLENCIECSDSFVVITVQSPNYGQIL